MGHNAYSRYSLEYHQHNPLLVENVNAWGVSKYYDFFVKGRRIKVAHCKNKRKMIFEAHPQLIIMDLQEGMVIKGI